MTAPAPQRLSGRFARTLRSVGPLKYGLGVVILTAALALSRFHGGIDRVLLVVGVMLFLATLLVLFSTLVDKKTSDNIPVDVHVKVLLWLVTCLTVTSGVLATSSFWFGLPLNWKVDGNAAPTPPTTLAIQFSPLLEPPYGNAIFLDEHGGLKMVRAVPELMWEMHAAISDAGDGYQGSGVIADKTAVREAFRVVLSNPTPHKIPVVTCSFEVTSYRKLPKRYITSWRPKGLRPATMVNLQLKPEPFTYPLIPVEKFEEIPADDTSIYVANISDASPGLYTVRARISYRAYDGSIREVTTEQQEFLVPLRSPDGPAGAVEIAVVNASKHRDLATRLLGLSESAFANLSRVSLAGGIHLAVDDGLTELVSGRDDDKLVTFLLEKKKAPAVSGVDSSDCLLPKPGVNARTCAAQLQRAHDPSAALRWLEVHVAQFPDDAEAQRNLIELLVKSNKIDEARIRIAPLRLGGLNKSDLYYDAALTVARADGDESKYSDLLREARRVFPDSALLLKRQIERYREQHAHESALQALIQFCKYYGSLSSRDDSLAFRIEINQSLHDVLMEKGSISAAVMRIEQECGRQIVADTRADIDLWAGLPQMGGDVPDDQVLDVARGYLAHENAAAAVELLAGFMKKFDSTDSRTFQDRRFMAAAELVGDAYVAMGRYEAAVESYVVSFMNIPRLDYEWQSRVNKALIMLGRAALQDRLPAMMRAVGDPSALAVIEGEKTEGSVDGLTGAPGVDAIVGLVAGCFMNNRDYVSKGIWGWSITDDPSNGYEWSAKIEPSTLKQLLAEVSNSDLATACGRHGLVGQFEDLVMLRYAAQPPLFAPRERALDETETVRRASQWSAALLYVLASSKENGAWTYMRYPDGIALSTEDGTQVREVSGQVDGNGLPYLEGTLELSEFKQRHAGRLAVADLVVFFNPLSRRQVQAEDEYRRGLIDAYRGYKVASARDRIRESLTIDPTNVAAWVSVSQLDANLHEFAQCVTDADRALALVSTLERAKALRAFCAGRLRSRN